MQVTLDLWHVISLAVSFFGASAAAGKLLLSQTQRHLDERFNSQESARASSSSPPCAMSPLSNLTPSPMSWIRWSRSAYAMC